MRETIVSIWRRMRDWVQATDQHDRSRELLGAILARQVAQIRKPASLAEVEFRVHSQFGDDGIIQWLIARIPNIPKRFVEFGVEDYAESNTRFLLIHNAWRGLVMDGSRENIARLKRRPWFWRSDLEARVCFVTRENVDSEIARWAGGEDVGLLHIDVDGNDYWLWDAVISIQPSVAILEYNGTFGVERAITIPYRPDFQRHSAHHSSQYCGASLAALTYLANTKGYALVGCNSAGNNAYFVRRDLLSEEVAEVDVVDAWNAPVFRDSRDAYGELDYLSLAERQAAIRGLPVVDVTTGTVVPF